MVMLADKRCTRVLAQPYAGLQSLSPEASAIVISQHNSDKTR